LFDSHTNWSKILWRKYSKFCHPSQLWVSYFTSSKYIKRLIEKDGRDSFSFEIRKIFSSILLARTWEHIVLRRLKVVEKDYWLNQSDGCRMISSKPSPGFTGHTHSISAKRKQAIAASKKEKLRRNTKEDV
jgi:hypothetical protein